MIVLIGSIGFGAALSERQSRDLMRQVRPNRIASVSPQTGAKLTSGYHRFAHSLLLSAIQEDPGNIMVSPISVYLAMAMVANGADGNTLKAMVETLAPGGSLDELDRQAAHWIDRLSTKEKGTSLELANSIWIQRGYQVAPPFLQANADHFNASARTLDFADADAPKEINSWVSEETRGRIGSIIDRTSADMLMILVNASYFKSMWDEPFSVSRTRERTFHSPSEEITTPFMHAWRGMVAIRMDEAEGVMLPYEGMRFWFFALLPNEGIDVRSWLGSQEPGLLYGALAQASEKRTMDVDLAIPTFVARYGRNLSEDLGKLGMSIAFQPGTADFSRMSAAGTKDLYISDVLHKTFIQVDERGTEAAAATAVMMKATAFAPQETMHIVFDRPFFHGIIDMETGLPLFLGILETPIAP